MNKNTILELINRINAHDVEGIIMEGHYPIQKPFLWEIPKTFWHSGQK